MKKVVSLMILAVVIAGLSLSGCEKKSDAEKAMDGLKKDMQSLTK
jgi:outer membrane murein-binding lipoprotein Lpp